MTMSGAGRILLVDDDAWMCRAATRMLESQLGAQVVYVHTARDAMDLVERGERFDAAIIDLQIGDLNGAQLIEELVAAQRDLRCGIWSSELWLSELHVPLASFVVEKHRWSALVEAVRELLSGTEPRSRPVSETVSRGEKSDTPNAGKKV